VAHSAHAHDCVPAGRHWQRRRVQACRVALIRLQEEMMRVSSRRGAAAAAAAEGVQRRRRQQQRRAEQCTHQLSRWRTVLKASVATRSPGLQLHTTRRMLSAGQHCSGQSATAARVPPARRRSCRMLFRRGLPLTPVPTATLDLPRPVLTSRPASSGPERRAGPARGTADRC
jgi:hypothetical protein